MTNLPANAYFVSKIIESYQNRNQNRKQSTKQNNNNKSNNEEFLTTTITMIANIIEYFQNIISIGMFIVVGLFVMQMFSIILFHLCIAYYSNIYYQSPKLLLKLMIITTSRTNISNNISFFKKRSTKPTTITKRININHNHHHDHHHNYSSNNCNIIIDNVHQHQYPYPSHIITTIHTKLMLVFTIRNGNTPTHMAHYLIRCQCKIL